MNRNFHLLLLILFPTTYFAYAGIDKYTFLDNINNWVIERKIDSNTQKISCRAYLPSNGSWFGAHIRLDSKNNLIVPSDLKKAYLASKYPKNKLIKALNNCRESLIYIP